MKKIRLLTSFYTDLRSLAAFRFGLGLCLIFDLCHRLGDFDVFYGQKGLLSLKTLPSFMLQGPGIHTLLIEDWAFKSAFVLQILIAILFTLGLKARLMAILSWVLLVSLQSRSIVLNAGFDDLMKMLFFWSIFAPISERFSIDSALTKGGVKKKHWGLNGGGIYIVFQMFILYFFAALIKNHSMWNYDFLAGYYALSVDQLSTSFGRYLLNFPKLLKLGTGFTFYLELLGPFLFFIPFKTSIFRLLGFVCFTSLHLGLELTMHLHFFPAISVIGLLSVLPGPFWDSLDKFFSLGRGINIIYDKECGFCYKGVHLLRTFLILPYAQIIPAQNKAEWHEKMLRENTWIVEDSSGMATEFAGIIKCLSSSPLLGPLSYLMKLAPISLMGTLLYRLVSRNRRFFSTLTRPLSWRREKKVSKWQALGAVPLVFVISWNIGSLDPFKYTDFIGPRVNNVVKSFGIQQDWHLFGPTPVRADGWFVSVGHFSDGSTADIFSFNEKKLSWDKPEKVPEQFIHTRWHKFYRHLYDAKTTLRRSYAEYVCRKWNLEKLRESNKKLVYFDLLYVLEYTMPPGQTHLHTPTQVWNQLCY